MLAQAMLGDAEVVGVHSAGRTRPGAPRGGTPRSPHSHARTHTQTGAGASAYCGTQCRRALRAGAQPVVVTNGAPFSSTPPL